MRMALLTLLVLTACASAPGPKAPDESHRVPVNRVMPPEASREDTLGKGTRKVRADGDVEWR